MKEEKRKRPARGSRREFTKAAAALLAAAPLALTAARAQTQPTPREPKAPPNPQPTPATPQQAQGPPSPVAAAYAEVARARFGEQLSPDEMSRVRRDLEGNVRNAERLRAHKLSNADEPDFVFRA